MKINILGNENGNDCMRIGGNGNKYPFPHTYIVPGLLACASSGTIILITMGTAGIQPDWLSTLRFALIGFYRATA